MPNAVSAEHLTLVTYNTQAMDTVAADTIDAIPHRFTIFHCWLSDPGVTIAALQETRMAVKQPFTTTAYTVHTERARKGRGGMALLTCRGHCQESPPHHDR